jgi:hypothetical protein
MSRKVKFFVVLAMLAVIGARRIGTERRGNAMRNSSTSILEW